MWLVREFRLPACCPLFGAYSIFSTGTQNLRSYFFAFRVPMFLYKICVPACGRSCLKYQERVPICTPPPPPSCRIWIPPQYSVIRRIGGEYSYREGGDSSCAGDINKHRRPRWGGRQATASQPPVEPLLPLSHMWGLGLLVHLLQTECTVQLSPGTVQPRTLHLEFLL